MRRSDGLTLESRERERGSERPTMARAALRLLRPKPKLCEHEVYSSRVAPALDGVRIGQISDVHVRRGVRPHVLHHAVETMNRLRPDIVALTGDYVCFSTASLPRLTAALRDLTVPAYAVLGNHDHNCGARAVRRALEKAGVDVLSNEHRRLKLRKGPPLFLVGVDDSVTRHHDPVSAFSGVPAGHTSVVLSHDPKSADFLHRWEPALILSGHTHGGQVFVEGLTHAVAQRMGIKYLSGFFDIAGAHLYVTRGLGAGIPVRFRAPREVAHLVLRSVGALPATTGNAA